MDGNMETETKCRNNRCYHFLVRREPVGYGANQYFCSFGINRPKNPCPQFTPRRELEPEMKWLIKRHQQ